MGASSSSHAATLSPAAAAGIFASPLEQAAFEKIVSETPVPREDLAYHAVLSAQKPLPHLSQTQIDHLNREYGDSLGNFAGGRLTVHQQASKAKDFVLLCNDVAAQNSLRSGNFRVLLRYVIHALPFSCRVAKMTHEELAAFAPGAAASDPVDSKPQTVDTHLHRTVNALFLVRQFVMRFVERQDECSLLAHFNHQPNEAFTRAQESAGSTLKSTTDATCIIDPITNRSSGDTYTPEDSSDDLAFRFLDALLSVLIEFPPTYVLSSVLCHCIFALQVSNAFLICSTKTYDLHVEVVSTLLVLLSPVAFPRDHSKRAGDLRAHNPFLHMIMAAASPDSRQSYWAAAVVCRLLQNATDQLQATGLSASSAAALVALQKAHDASLVAISETCDHAEELEHFSYLTLEGVGTIAGTVLVLLVLLQSCRDSDSPVASNPFRAALCGITDAADMNRETTDSEDPRQRLMHHVDTGGDSGAEKLLELSYSALFAAIGRHAPYETSHLLLYTLLYSNPMMLDAAVSNCEMERLLLPLLETLYHARSVEPSRLYMLVIVLLTFTQDPAFVRAAHTQLVVPNVPWYQERYMLDVSLGSLMMVIFTRLIFRNITHLQDSFIHLNAFAALSNLARSAENLHVYAAQSVVGLIDMLAKNEAKLVAQMQRLRPTENEENDVLVQKRAAYVEFIRLLLGVVSSCLKTKLLPRNPQLIYSLLHRADTFTALEQHPEFAAQVNNGPVWSTLARFRALVESKTSPDDVLDVDTVLELIRAECVSLLAATSASSGPGGASAASKASVDDDDASYRYEEEADPEQFFVPYVWKLIQEQTPDFCWKVDKITLFVPSGVTAPTSVVTG
ncbi:hypothetical protein BBJ28_00022051 [Nothophytophthora sp. Chile5]|nr:hypothetical protein BBJ28_00022051 [Nothophytophthora sp. Chile5]